MKNSTVLLHRQRYGNSTVRSWKAAVEPIKLQNDVTSSITYAYAFNIDVALKVEPVRTEGRIIVRDGANVKHPCSLLCTRRHERQACTYFRFTS